MLHSFTFILFILASVSVSLNAENSLERFQSRAAQSVRDSENLTKAQFAVNLVAPKFYPDKDGNPALWRMVPNSIASGKPRVDVIPFDTASGLTNWAGSWGGNYVSDKSGLASLKSLSALNNSSEEQDGFIGISSLESLNSSQMATYFGNETSRFPAASNTIQKIPVVFKSVSFGAQGLVNLNVQVGVMNIDIPVPLPGGWYQEAYIKAPNAGANDQFGRAAVISGDTLVVGADFEDSDQTTITNGTTASSNNNRTDSGAVYIYQRTGSIWTQEAYIKAPNADASDLFGYIPSALSGNTLVVGAYAEDSNQTTITNGTTGSSNNDLDASGAVYVFRRINSGGNNTSWVQEAYIKSPNSDAQDYFGFAVGISGDLLVVGAPNEDSNQTTITNSTSASSDDTSTDSGAVYVFWRTSSNWTQEAYIKASNGDSGDCFGKSIGISGDTLVVGSDYEDSSQTTITNGPSASTDNTLLNSGAAYVFKRTSSGWIQEAYLKASNAGSGDSFAGFFRGARVSGDRIVLGAPFEDSNQLTITNGTTASSNDSSIDSGAAYVYKRSTAGWAQEAYLKPSNSDPGDNFGRSVDISGDAIVVGAWKEASNQTTITNGTFASSDNSAPNSGAAYVFRGNSGAWTQEAYLKASNGESGVAGTLTTWGVGDQFGLFTSISGDTIAVGSWHEDSNQTTITNGPTASSDNSLPDSGAVYVFRKAELSMNPSVSSVTPSRALCPGNSIVIIGNGFMKDALVRVGDQPCISKTTQGANEIVCELPAQPNSIPGT
ncbi:MAG: IPT/TIG domain-containing protein, partial [Pseudomonadota bacterium]